jgi:hypothetical protein
MKFWNLMYRQLRYNLHFWVEKQVVENQFVEYEVVKRHVVENCRKDIPTVKNCRIHILSKILETTYCRKL